MGFETIPEDHEERFLCDCGGEITYNEELKAWECNSCDSTWPDKDFEG